MSDADTAPRETDDAIIERLGAYNEIKVVRVDSYVDVEHDRRNVRAMFMINGEKYMVDAKDANDMIGGVYSRVAERITAEIMNQLMKSNRRL